MHTSLSFQEMPIRGANKKNFLLSSEETVEILRTLHSRPVLSGRLPGSQNKHSLPIDIKNKSDTTGTNNNAMSLSNGNVSFPTGETPQSSSNGNDLPLLCKTAYRTPPHNADSDSDEETYNSFPKRRKDISTSDATNDKLSSVNAVKVTSTTQLYRVESEAISPCLLYTSDAADE